METVSYQRISDTKPTHIITACGDADTCPGCGAGYKVGLSACEYCRQPMRFHTGCEYVPAAGIALLQRGEAIIPAGIEG